jgi:hypothetical protein
MTTTEQHRNASPRESALRRARIMENLRSVVVTGLISASLLSVAYGVTVHRAAEQRSQHQALVQHEAAIEAQADRPPT